MPEKEHFRHYYLMNKINDWFDVDYFDLQTDLEYYGDYHRYDRGVLDERYDAWWDQHQLANSLQ